MSRKRRLVIVVATVVVTSVIFGAWSLYEVTESVTDAYSMECMSLVIVEHLSTEGSWPASYEDLADDYTFESCRIHEPLESGIGEESGTPIQRSPHMCLLGD